VSEGATMSPPTLSMLMQRCNSVLFSILYYTLQRQVLLYLLQ